MIYDLHSVIKEKKPMEELWAFQFRPNKSDGLLYYCQPTKGVIVNGNNHGNMAYINPNTAVFIPTGLRGHMMKSKAVSITARMFADTKEEATDGFNRLIQDEIDKYAKKIETLKKYMI